MRRMCDDDDDDGDAGFARLQAGTFWLASRRTRFSDLFSFIQ